MALTAGTRLGPYEIVDPLGAGGMGEVYRARDPRLGRDVAVKLVSTDGTPSPDRLRRFETEARAAAQLSHPNVVTVFDVGTHEGQPYLVLELLEGKTLREALRGAAPSLREAVGWGLDAARGLGAAHERGIVHRDLKPENVFLTEDGRIKVLDFGLAKLHEPLVDDSEREAPTEERGTKPGMVLGTVGYMAPEQVRGEAPDARTDVFALGAVLYELVTRRRPFGGSSEGEILAAILRDEPPAPSSIHAAVPPALDGVVRRCLAKPPSERFSSAREVAAALETVLASLGAGRFSAARPPEVRGPYPGLESFRESDTERFFGREAEVEALWAKLHERRLLAVIGPSGVGKTSFVRAGVLASRPTGWAAVVCAPGASPFRSLGQALAPRLADNPEALGQLVSFDDLETAVGLMERWRRSHTEALLVVDQLEELFTLSPEDEQARFAELIGRVSTEADVHIVLSMRDDFLMRCSEHDTLSRVFTELTPLRPLSGDGLRRALVEPAKREGFSFEEGLAEEMLQAVEGARGALPLLAFAVSRLWQKRDRERKLLTRGAYEEIGGVAGALAQHAEATLERIGEARQPLVREIFRNLVTAQGTRASCEREELLSAFPEPAAAETALEELIDARLLTSYEVPVAEDGREAQGPSAERRYRIEIVHESLLKAWPRLVWWQAQDEEGAQLRDQLRQAARLWEEKGRTEDLLWSGTAEREFEVWRERYPGQLTAVEDDFAKAMVERARRARRFRRIAVASIVAVALAVAAVTATLWQSASAEARRAEAAQLLTRAEARIEEDPTEALALATASLELADTEAARVFAVRALADSPPALEVATDALDRHRVPVFSPDGRWLAAAGFVEEAAVWREDGQGPLQLEGLATSTQCPNVPLWPSPSLLATGLYCGGQVQIWSLPGGERLGQIDYDNRRFEGGMLAALWSVGVDRVFVHTQDPTGRRVDLRFWTLPDAEGRSLGEIRPEELEATSINRGRSWGAFEPGGGGWLYARGREVVRLPLPVRSGRPVAVDRHPDDVVELYAPSRASQGWVSIDRSGEIHVHSGPPASAPVVLHRPAEAPEGSYPGPSGRWIAAGSEDPPELRVWDTVSPSRARPLRLRRRGSNMDGWDIHPSGDWIVLPSAGNAGLTFWPLRHPRPLVIDGDGGFALTFSSDGRLLAFVSDGAVHVWSIEGTRVSEVRRVPLPENAGGVGGLTFGPDGRFVLTGGDRALLIPLDGGSPRKLEGFPDTVVLSTALSPSGRRVAGGTFAGRGPKRIRVWDLESGETRVFDSPTWQAPSSDAGQSSEEAGVYEGSVLRLAFVGEDVLYTAGLEGIWRWDLEGGTNERVSEAAPGFLDRSWLSQDGRTAVTLTELQPQKCATVEVLDTATGALESLPRFGGCVIRVNLDPSGTVLLATELDGTVRVGRVADAEPHLILGHEGGGGAAISPDLRWVATSGNGTICLWPMPDLDQPPLHALPHDALLAKLKSLTNLRAVRDAEDPSGWTIDVGPFPGWKEVPTW